MPVRRLISLLLVLQGLMLAGLSSAQPENSGTSPQQTTESGNPVAASVYLMLTTLGGSPGDVSVELNGSHLGELHPGSGMVVAVLPDSRNFLLLRSRFAGIHRIRLTDPAAGEKLYYRVFIDIFNSRVLRVEPLAERDGEKLAAEIRFVTPDTSP